MKGFTLIELLVVVLIIGILSAVALPQYQRAVEKSRFSVMYPFVKSLAVAQSAYVMANGTPARSFADLDVSLPSNCRIVLSDYYGEVADCGNRFTFLLDNAFHTPSGRIYVDGNELYVSFPTAATPAHLQNITTCMACGKENNRAHKLCLSLGGKWSSKGNCDVYNLP